jgi:hypothetical protein
MLHIILHRTFAYQNFRTVCPEITGVCCLKRYADPEFKHAIWWRREYTSAIMAVRCRQPSCCHCPGAEWVAARIGYPQDNPSVDLLRIVDLPAGSRSFWLVLIVPPLSDWWAVGRQFFCSLQSMLHHLRLPLKLKYEILTSAVMI